MSAQTNYSFGMPYGCAGGIVDLAPYMINTFFNAENDGVMKFGRAVVDGTTAGKDVKLPTSTSDVFEGITVANRTTQMDLNGVANIFKNSPIGVMKYGNVYGKLATGVEPTYGAAVYVVVAGDDKGCFTTSSSSTLPINAKFVSAANNGVAMIELQQENVTPAQAYTLPTASASQLGGVKVGTGLKITDGVLSVDE